MKNFKYIFLPAVCLSFSISMFGEKLSSPDNQLQLNVDLNSEGQPFYELTYKGKNVINSSLLGLECKDDINLTTNFKIAEQNSSTFDETWQPVWGETSDIRNNYNELELKLIQDKTNREMILRFRLYDDGLGFRYEFPNQDNLTYFVVTDEKTQFAMNGDHKAFWLPGDYDTQEYKIGRASCRERVLRLV